MSRPIKEGGLDLQSIRAMNRAARIRITWQLLTNKGSLSLFVKSNLRLSVGSCLKRCGLSSSVDFWHD